VLEFESVGTTAEDRHVARMMTRSVRDMLEREMDEMDDEVIDLTMADRILDSTDDSLDELYGADFALQGAVRVANGRVQVTAELFDVNEHYHVWSETYDSQVAELPLIQRDIAEGVAEIVREYHDESGESGCMSDSRLLRTGTETI
jgi:TolB-like protein